MDPDPSIHPIMAVLMSSGPALMSGTGLGAQSVGLRKLLRDRKRLGRGHFRALDPLDCSCFISDSKDSCFQEGFWDE